MRNKRPSHSCPAPTLLLRLLVFFFAAPCSAADPAGANVSPGAREHLLLDANWKFHLGDDWPNALRLDKAGASSGPAAEKFSDLSWRSLDLPHDWAIELPFDEHADRSHGFKPVGPGFSTNSIGWYRRTFNLPASDKGGRIWLQFDGVFRDATVWVNGWLVARHEGGYYPFREDITDLVHWGGPNVIAVRVDASKFEGWFYEGAGIYRHVWLEKTAPVAINPDGIFVSSRFKNNTPSDFATINIETTLLNASGTNGHIIVISDIFSPDGRPVGRSRASVQLRPASTGSVSLQTKLSKYELWSPESPQLYNLRTTVQMDGKTIDAQETVFGIRTFAFDPERGFLLNGRPYALKGTCNHQDHAGVGAALPDRLQEFRITRLKEFGCNAYRCSHNPPTPELLDACDRLGLLVMDESRLLGSDHENLNKWTDLIRRDRNHASVAIWSVANEEFSVQSSPEGANAARTMQELVNRLDPTRPVTYAAPQGDAFYGINTVIDVRGWNYHIGPDMDNYHKKHPTQPNVGTEQGSTLCTRGIYGNDTQRGYVSAYDTNVAAWSHTAERWWSYFAERPWLSGGFVWTGFDYRGEPTPYSWPCINSHFGILDTCGFPKDNFYYYRSWWTTNPVLHLLPHWNWQGKEDQEIRVDALSNCEEVELFLNDKSLGRKPMKRNAKLSWQVKYAPGKLAATGYIGNRAATRTMVETTGKTASVQLGSQTGRIRADGEDLSIITVKILDGQGRLVPTATNKIEFALTGPGRILGVGNGDPSCHESDTYFPSFSTKTFAVDGWRWKMMPLPPSQDVAPEYLLDFDDSSWVGLTPHTNAMVLRERQSAIFRAYLNVRAEALDDCQAFLRFPGIDNHAWFFVNGQTAGECHDWQAQAALNVTKLLRPGNNSVAVAIKNDDGPGGMKTDVSLECIGNPVLPVWSRSVFGGLAQILVQSTPTSGKIVLTARSEGLAPASLPIETTPARSRLNW